MPTLIRKKWLANFYITDPIQHDGLIGKVTGMGNGYGVWRMDIVNVDNAWINFRVNRRQLFALMKSVYIKSRCNRCVACRRRTESQWNVPNYDCVKSPRMGPTLPCWHIKNTHKAKWIYEMLFDCLWLPLCLRACEWRVLPTPMHTYYAPRFNFFPFSFLHNIHINVVVILSFPV